MRKFITLSFVVAVLACTLMPAPAEAKPQIITWEIPTTDCDGVPLAQGDFVEFELIYSTSPMPMPSDSAGPCDATPDPEAPSGALTVSVPVTETSKVLNMQPGETYFFRARVSAYVNGNWSSWTAEISKTIPYGRPDKFIIADGKLQYTIYVIDDSAIRLN